MNQLRNSSSVRTRTQARSEQCAADRSEDRRGPHHCERRKVNNTEGSSPPPCPNDYGHDICGNENDGGTVKSVGAKASPRKYDPVAAAVAVISTTRLADPAATQCSCLRCPHMPFGVQCSGAALQERPNLRAI
mmetsp:Transcript_46421/g.140590  ORF Transcript_46421/g.140590 Transcript_46421/m.140590 type:complete len:133 (-) Transcript_46421:702-1100(-)